MLGALFFLSLPIIVKLSVTVYVDLGLIFFSTAALICLVKWQEKKFKFKYFFISGLCCGLALSTKYNGLITCFILTAFTPLLYLNGNDPSHFKKKENKFIQIKAAGFGLFFLCISTAIFSPWMIKNHIWTQNPVYPLFNTYFNPIPLNPEPGTIHEKHKLKAFSINHFQIRKQIHKESWFETAIIPIRIFFQGEDNNPKFFDGKLNPLLFFLPLFAFATTKKTTRDRSHKKIFLLFSILYILIVFFRQDMRIRWIGPAIPPLVILSIFGLKNLFSYLKTTSPLISQYTFSILYFKKIFISLLIISMAGLNAVYIYQLFGIIAPQEYLCGQVSRSVYIERSRPEYAALEYSNRHLKEKVKLFAFFLGNRMYYSDHDIKFNIGEFKLMIQQSKNQEQIYQKLKLNNFTHLIINYSLFNAWIDTTFNNDEKNRIKNFFNHHTKRLFFKGGHGVYELIKNN